MGKYRFSFHITGKGTHLDDDRLIQMVEAIYTQYYGAFKTMNLGLTGISPYEPFNALRFKEYVIKEQETDGYLFAEIDKLLQSDLEFCVSRSNDKNVIRMVIDHDNFINEGGSEKIYNLFITLSRLMPGLCDAVCGPVMSSYFYDKIDMTRVLAPHSGRYLYWIHILGPSEYAPKYLKEELLNAPAYRVEEWENDVVFMMCYENPFEYDLPENVERVRKISDYLDDKERVVQIE
jgi:hypothetical protein